MSLITHAIHPPSRTIPSLRKHVYIHTSARARASQTDDVFASIPPITWQSSYSEKNRVNKLSVFVRMQIRFGHLIRRKSRPGTKIIVLGTRFPDIHVYTNMLASLGPENIPPDYFSSVGRQSFEFKAADHI